MPSRRYAVLLAIATLALAGCYTSDVPLDPTPTQPLDAALVGSWRCLGVGASVDDDAITLRVARGADRVYAIEWEEKDKTKDRYEAYASSLKGGSVLNVRDLGPNASKSPWVFARYAFLQPNVMRFQIASDQVLGDKQLSPAALRTTLERHAKDPALYSDFCVCVRAKEEAAK